MTENLRNFTINFGPQHPAAHGVLRLVLELDGELDVVSGTVLNLSRPVDGLSGTLEPLDLSTVKEILLTFRQNPDEQAVRDDEERAYRIVGHHRDGFVHRCVRAY